jgi:hypothetical protein
MLTQFSIAKLVFLSWLHGRVGSGLITAAATAASNRSLPSTPAASGPKPKPELQYVPVPSLPSAHLTPPPPSAPPRRPHLRPLYL